MKKIMSMVFAFLGISSLGKDASGKDTLTEEQKKKLEDRFGKDFTDKFSAALTKGDSEDSEETTAELISAITANNGAQVTNLSKQLSDALAQIKTLQDNIQTLSDKPETDPAPEGVRDLPRKAGVPSIMRVNMSLKHYSAVSDYLKYGHVTPGAASTIDVADLRTEFGTYLNTQRNLEMLNQLFVGFETSQYMTPKLAITEYRATQALITSVVQQFTPKWTPAGKSKFTPITIKNRRHKINVPIVPAEVLDSYMMYLYDEGLSPDQMPITRYILQQLILPVAQQDIEIRMIAKGKYTEKPWGNVNAGDPGLPPEDGMDGFETVIMNGKAAAGTEDDMGINFFNNGDFNYLTASDDDILENTNEFVDWLNPQYARKNMPVFCSPEYYKRYKRAYKNKWGQNGTGGENPNFGSDRIDFSNNVLTPLLSMYRSPILFSTPKENFIKLRNRNEVPSIINDVQKHDYEVRHYGEFWLGGGFAIGEGVFAQAPASYNPYAAITQSWGASNTFQKWNSNPGGDSDSGGL